MKELKQNSSVQEKNEAQHQFKKCEEDAKALKENQCTLNLFYEIVIFKEPNVHLIFKVA